MLSELFLIGTSAAIIWLVQHPEDLRYIKPWLLRSSANTCRQIAERAWRTALKLESKYASEVRP